MAGKGSAAKQGRIEMHLARQLREVAEGRGISTRAMGAMMGHLALPSEQDLHRRPDLRLSEFIAVAMLLGLSPAEMLSKAEAECGGLSADDLFGG